jgi:hypothetical protein
MEPNNLCSSLIAYGSYAPGGNNHHLFSDLPGDWVRGRIVATAIGNDELGPGERDMIEAWTIEFKDCTAEMFPPEWENQEKQLYDRWQELDRGIGAGWGRGSMRWWPANSDPIVGQNGMIVVNVYLPLNHFPYLTSVEEPLKPFRQEVLDIWVGYFEPNRQGSYFEEHYEEDNDDVPISEFAGDQGELWIGHDFMEVGFTTLPSSIAELVTGHSWSDEYVDELTKRVAKNGMSRFNSFAFVTAGNVKNPISVTKEGVELHFMGQFTIRT